MNISDACNSYDHRSPDLRNSLAKHRASVEPWKTTYRIVIYFRKIMVKTGPLASQSGDYDENDMIIRRPISLTSGKSTQRWLYSGCLGSLPPHLQSLDIGSILNMIKRIRVVDSKTIWVSILGEITPQKNLQYAFIIQHSFLQTWFDLVDVPGGGESCSHKTVRSSPC